MISKLILIIFICIINMSAIITRSGEKNNVNITPFLKCYSYFKNAVEIDENNFLDYGDEHLKYLFKNRNENIDACFHFYKMFIIKIEELFDHIDE